MVTRCAELCISNSFSTLIPTLAGMWSMTVPFLIASTCNFVSLLMIALLTAIRSKLEPARLHGHKLRFQLARNSKRVGFYRHQW
ncbi:Uncharacterised protein [Vibrio cholerae]|nr:Uncharacterised protein [Vibrio cholerae]CSC32142.1 Uncharacterised protein [Vibrio cholerae]CSC64382.1 Uncharacterised protein [Vibrio cholerae]CSC97302.1 Uncharacterised protein [Vibrio cholerae]